MVVRAANLSNQELEARRPGFQSQPHLHGKCEANLGNM